MKKDGKVLGWVVEGLRLEGGLAGRFWVFWGSMMGGCMLV